MVRLTAPLPSLDLARGRLRLAPTHLGVLRCLVEDTPVPPELHPARDELQSAGVLNESGEPIPEAAALGAVVSAPVLTVLVETVGPQGLSQHGLLVSARSCYSYESWPTAVESEYSPEEPITAVWVIARMVALLKRPSSWDGPGEVPASADLVNDMVALLASLGSGAHAESLIRARLTEVAGFPLAAELRPLARLLPDLRGAWHVTVSWRDQNGPRSRELGVLDIGPRGYWRRGSESLVRTDRGEIWKALTDLIPSSADLGTTAGTPAARRTG